MCQRCVAPGKPRDLTFVLKDTDCDLSLATTSSGNSLHEERQVDTRWW
ncbi:hypothetical protein PAAG_12006 [Paracoccidioides lutzii Pb01]|uniref:Uncharacterized protein n=1 Tax=Paracoccidioides lutzii (strain ATCC MYA-826 / Pb01) TaxID=502779 RepID=A0A0A2V5A1_PARBA|nr:hypothetical protein PAAG_12006 [Paracoccidioides lutzii Pb01]KGQ01325.1 hypothetical protein PAAG_12006 [Paracoccidioides lutzii Pb01]